MSAETQAGSIAGEAAGSSQEKLPTGLVTLLFTDIVGSVALKQQVGDRPAARLIEAHHQLVRETLREAGAGKEIETAGDSFLIMFTTPSEAVTFALRLQGRLRELKREQAVPVLDRLGIHLGEVVIREHAEGLKPRDLYGSNVDICARVMSLAKGGQVLMSRGVFDSARQVLKGEDIEGVGQLEWLNHGPYLLKGLDEPVEICEVREAGQQILSPPTSSEKAQRQVRPDEEPVLGWRPAVGQAVPHTKWILEKKLGEGGFGEVWLGRHQAMKERRVFKFCFRADRVRSLKREMTLFRLIKERIGDHPNIVSLREVYFDEPPFYVEMDYVEGQDLKSWCEAQGGAEKVPLETRLEIVAQVADALQAAHDAGVIHRDVKPGNILVQSSSRREEAHTSSDSDGGRKENEPPHVGCYEVLVKLTDFGIGQVVSQEYLAGVTKAGFTMTLLGSESSSQSGTQLYMAPELLAGKPASTRSDIYSLGVVLYQLVTGDFTRPVTSDWAKRISDPLLRDDLERCFAGEPQERFSAVELLAKNVRALPERRQALRKQAAEKAALERAAYRRGMMRTAGAAAGIVAIIAGLAVLALSEARRAKAAAQAERQQRQRAESSDRESRHLLYVANMRVAQDAAEQNNPGRLRELLQETDAYPDRGFEWYYWQRQLHLELKTLYGHSAPVRAVAFSPDGQRILTGSEDGTGKVWDAATGQELLTLKHGFHSVDCAAFSPDGRKIVTGSSGSPTRIWDAVSGKPLLTMKVRSCSAAFSPNGKRIATATGNRGRVWDAATGKPLLELKGHSGTVVSVAFSPDGKKIVTGSGDETVKVWDAVSGEDLLTLRGGFGQHIAAFSPDGRQIASAGMQDMAVRAWDVASGRELRTYPRGSDLYSVAFSPDGRWIVAAGNRTVAAWDLVSGKELFTLKGHTNQVWSVAWSPDGRRIVTGSCDGTAKIWQARDREAPRTLTGPTNSGAVNVAFYPDSRRAVTGLADGTAKVWDATTSAHVLTLNGHHDGQINSVAVSADGQRIVTGGVDGKVKLWNAANGKELMSIQAHGGVVMAGAFSPDGRRIVTGSMDMTAKVWDAATGTNLFTFSRLYWGVPSVAFSPDGQRILTGDDFHAKLWDVSTGKLSLTLEGQSQAVAFSPDGRRIMTGSAAGTLTLWDAATGAQLYAVAGQNSWITWAAFSPDGRRIVTGGRNRTATVWEAATGRELLMLKGHTNAVWTVDWSRDSQRIITGGDDATARVWEIATPQQVEAWQTEETRAVERLQALRQERESVAQREKALRVQDPGAIKEWLVLAAIHYQGQSTEEAVKALDQKQVPREENLRPHAGERVNAGGIELVWTPLRLADYVIDFQEHADKATQSSVAYAVAYVQSETERKGIVMKAGSSDEAKIYLNGQEIYRNTTSRDWAADEDDVPGVHLKAGVNVLVFKVVNENFKWQGSIRFTDPAGQPIKGIRVGLDPETLSKIFH